MLQTILILAAEAHEPSKTAFYATGGALAAWAVVLTAIGMRSQTFPSGTMAERGVIALTGVLVAATMYAAVVTG